MFKKTIKNCALGVSLLLGASFASFAAPIPVDLSTWESDGQGTWNLQGSNDTVLQTINGEPTVFFEAGSNAQGTQISGSIEVTTTGDDDFIGFVLGYQDNEMLSATGQFILVDWKQGTQNFSNQTADAGLAISLVDGATNALDFWGHSGNVTEVQRGTNLGSTGWADQTSYLFDITFTSSLIEVFVDNVLEISISATAAGLASFGDGAVGFYNYSQSSVLYAGIAEQAVSNPVNAPGMLALFLIGLAGIRRIRRA